MQRSRRWLALLVALAALVTAIGMIAVRHPQLAGFRAPWRTPIASPPPYPAQPPSVGTVPRPPEKAQLNAELDYPGLVYAHGDRRMPLVALTFDDGPDSLYTPRVLDILKAKGVKATFFFVGQNTMSHPDVARRTLAEGHAIGNHTWAHPRLTKATAATVGDELDRAATTLKQVIGQAPVMFRPPFGYLNTTIVTEAQRRGLKIILWDVDSLDWKSLSRNEIVGRVVPTVKYGSFILQHSYSGGPTEDLDGSLQALPVLINQLQARGMRFVTVPEMLKMTAGTLPEPAPTPLNPPPAPAPPPTSPPAPPPGPPPDPNPFGPA